MSALVVVPTYLRAPADLDVTLETIESVRRTEPTVEVLIVDDCSPAAVLADALETHCERLNFRVTRKPENSGFSSTVNVGLREALDRGIDCVLMNADIECQTDGWLSVMQAQLDTQGRPASVVGALLLYPMGLIQHAGIFFSLLTRSFDHRYRFGPGNLSEAHQRCLCPVTGAFQFIRNECLQTVGIYDSDFYLGYEDVDFCLRVFESGRECIYVPGVNAFHHESLFRGGGRLDQDANDKQSQAFAVLMKKHLTTNLARWIPELV